LLIVAVLAVALAVGAFFILNPNTNSSSLAERGPTTTTPKPSTVALENPPLRTPGEAKTYTVLMRNEGGRFFFDPVALHVLPGDSVVWFNLGDNHSTTAYALPNKKAGGVAVPQRIPEGAAPWDSGILGIQDRGLTFSYTFKQTGTYDYYCFPHEFLGMAGRIVVDTPGGPAETDSGEGLSDESINTFAALPSVDIVSDAGTTYNWEAEINTALLKAFEKDATGALAQAQVLLDHADQVTPLLGTNAAAFTAALSDYVELVRSQAGFTPLAQQGDVLKGLLAKARK